MLLHGKAGTYGDRRNGRQIHIRADVDKLNLKALLLMLNDETRAGDVEDTHRAGIEAASEHLLLRVVAHVVGNLFR